MSLQAHFSSPWTKSCHLIFTRGRFYLGQLRWPYFDAIFTFGHLSFYFVARLRSLAHISSPWTKSCHPYLMVEIYLSHTAFYLSRTIHSRTISNGQYMYNCEAVGHLSGPSFGPLRTILAEAHLCPASPFVWHVCVHWPLFWSCGQKRVSVHSW